MPEEGDSPAAAAGGIRAGVVAGLVASVACLAVIAATPNDSYWIGDCGAKALLAKRLLATGYGTLHFDYPAHELDPDGSAFPILPPFAIRQGDGFVSQYPPAYPALSAPFLAWLGPAGLRIPAALGVAACAYLFSLWTAPAFGAIWAAAGGITLAVATPLAFYGVTVWEHSITVALILGAIVALTRRVPSRMLLAGALVASAGWFREETLLALPALALGSWLRDRSIRDVAWIAAGAAPPVAALGAFNFAAFGSPLGVHVGANLHARPPLLDSIAHAGTLLGGTGASPLEGVLLPLAALAAVALGAAAAWRGETRSIALVASSLIGVAIWGRGSAAIHAAEIPLIELARYNGFAVQMPLICLAGIGASRAFREAAFAPLRLGIITGLAFLAFFLPFRVTLSEFAIGGHWGPRMLLPAAPAFVALALAAVQRPRGVRNRVGFAVAAVFVAAGLLSSALAVSMLDAQKRAVGALQRRLAATSQQVLVTTHPALGQHLAEFWGERALLLARNPAHLSALAADLQQRDVPEFLLVWQPRPRFGPPRVDGARCTPSGRHRDVEVRRVFDVDFYTCTFPPVTSSGSSRRPIRSGDAPLGEDPRRAFDAALALHTRDRRDDLARTHGP